MRVPREQRALSGFVQRRIARVSRRVPRASNAIGNRATQ